MMNNPYSYEDPRYEAYIIGFMDGHTDGWGTAIERVRGIIKGVFNDGKEDKAENAGEMPGLSDKAEADGQ